MRCIIFIVSLYLCSIKCYVATNNKHINNLAKQNHRFTIEELLTTNFAKRTSNDRNLDPCKASLFLGDIAFSKIRSSRIRQIKRVARAATAKKERLWDHGVIPYEIDEEFSGRKKALFKQAMRHWENFTCVKFVERDRSIHSDYILFTERPCGCCSFVGKKGSGAQAISIGSNCDKFGVVVHELGHVVGLWHEHTRPDRDNYINIIKDNIMNGQEYNFNKLNSEEVTTLGLGYDYNSIMHYARNTFSKGSYFDTIQPIESSGKPLPDIGQRIRLSEMDILQTNLLYKCPRCGGTYQANSATFSVPSDLHPEDSQCEWRITATHGEKIVLNITKLNIGKSLNCTDDYLEIRDGYWQKSPVLKKLCGTEKSELITSTGNRMLLTYVAKNSNAGFTANYKAICGGKLVVDDEGHLESPNYPADYQPIKECIWKITVPENFKAVLRFQSFDVENHDSCLYDYVEIRDGFSLDSRLIEIFCGYEIPPDIISSSNHLLVKFVSDGSGQKGGFSATIMKEYDECSMINHGCAQDCVNTLGSYKCACQVGFELHSDGKNCVDACGGTLNISNGTITSPSFPNLYPINKICVWEIIVQVDHQIVLNFTHFDIEGNNNQLMQQCEFDSLEVTSKVGGDNIVKHGTYCGSKKPNHITSEENVLRVTFKSDDSFQKTGFAAVFFSDLNECAKNNGGCQHQCVNTIGSYKCTCRDGFNLDLNSHDCVKGDCTYEVKSSFGTIKSPNYPDNYPSRKSCVWYFSTTPGHRIRLSFLQFSVEPHQECYYDNVALYDGFSSDVATLGKLCGYELPEPIETSGNELYMTFKSDTSVQKNGFWATHAAICGGVLQANGDEKMVYSHARFGEANYENNAECDWYIKAPFGHHVKISFLMFELEDEVECDYDYVEVFSGADTSGVSYGKFCGTDKPPDITSLKNALMVSFLSDESFTTKGFTFMYKAVEFHEEQTLDMFDSSMETN